MPGSAEHFTTATPSTASPIAAPVSGGLKHRGEEIALGTGTETLGAAAWININSKISHWKGIFPAKMARLHGTSCHCFMARPCVGRHTSAVCLLVGLGGLFLHGHVKAGRVPNPGS